MRIAGDAPSAQDAAEILLQLVGALDVHDRITRGHSERVRAYSSASDGSSGSPRTTSIA